MSKAHQQPVQGATSSGGVSDSGQGSGFAQPYGNAAQQDLITTSGTADAGQGGLPRGEVEVGTGDADVGVGTSDDGQSIVGQLAISKSKSIGKNIYGPIYAAGTVGVKAASVVSAGKEVGGAIKLTAEAGVRLGVGAAKLSGEEGFEIGAGGELKGQVEATPIGISHDRQDGWKVDAMTGTFTVAGNPYIVAQINGKGPKVTLPGKKYELFQLIGGKIEKSQFHSFEYRDGPGLAQLKADAQAALDVAKRKANEIADAVEEHAPEAVKDGAANAASRLIEGRSEEERMADQAASQEATNASHQQFLAWWRGHRARLAALGVPAAKRNEIFGKYTAAWRYLNPGDTEVMPNAAAAANLRAEAQQLERDAIAAAKATREAEERRKRETMPEQRSAANEAPVPAAIRGEVKNRVENRQLNGNIPHGGIDYTFRFESAQDHILVYGGPQSSIVSYRPSWK